MGPVHALARCTPPSWRHPGQIDIPGARLVLLRKGSTTAKHSRRRILMCGRRIANEGYFQQIAKTTTRATITTSLSTNVHGLFTDTRSPDLRGTSLSRICSTQRSSSFVGELPILQDASRCSRAGNCTSMQ
jgi:hypothetical protein